MDAVRVYEVQYGKLDHQYMEKWVQTLDIKEFFERLKEKAEPIK